MKMQTTLLATAIAGTLALAYPSLVQSQAAAAPAASAPAAKQRSFPSPELAAQALIDAVKARDVNGMLAVVGPASKTWLFSGDSVADANDWKKFVAAYDERK